MSDAADRAAASLRAAFFTDDDQPVLANDDEGWHDNRAGAQPLMPSINEARFMSAERLAAAREKTEMEALGVSIMDYLERPETKKARSRDLRRALLRSLVLLKAERDDLAAEWDDDAA